MTFIFDVFNRPFSLFFQSFSERCSGEESTPL